MTTPEADAEQPPLPTPSPTPAIRRRDADGGAVLPYRLIALDLDGTVMGKGRPIAPRVVAAVAEAQRRGAHVAIATGRMYCRTTPFAEELGSNAPIICYQGAWVRDPRTGERLLEQGVPLDLAHEVIELTRELGLFLNVYLDDTIHIEAVTPAWEHYFAHSNGANTPRVVGDMRRFLTREPTHLAIVTQAEQTRELVHRVSEHFAGRLYVTTGHPLFCELSSPAVSKGNALRFLAEHLGVPREQVMAVGDNLNDITMVNWAGLGIAMGNAEAELVAVADEVVGTVEQDGVAEAIERFVLSADRSGTSSSYDRRV